MPARWPSIPSLFVALGDAVPGIFLVIRKAAALLLAAAVFVCLPHLRSGQRDDASALGPAALSNAAMFYVRLLPRQLARNKEC